MDGCVILSFTDAERNSACVCVLVYGKVVCISTDTKKEGGDVGLLLLALGEQSLCLAW